MKKVLGLILFLFLASCSPKQPVSATISTSTSLEFEVSPTSVMMLASRLPTSTPSPTHTPIPAPTRTSLPTINPKVGKEILYTWLEGSNICRFPCWAGIIPASTTWEAAEHILQPLEGMTELEFRLARPCMFGECNYVTWALSSDLNTYGNVYSTVKENTIHLIQLQIVDPDLVKALSLQNILKQYGKPTIILLSTEPDLPGDLFVELILVYPDNQFIIKYSKYAKLISHSVVSCGQDSYVALTILNNKEQLRSIDAIANAVETKDLHVDVWHKSVEEALEMTIDEFYETFRKPNAPCITTPIGVWQP